MEPGLSAEITHVVDQGDTATSQGSGDVEVLATPRVVALCERAAVAAIAASMPPGRTSVGTRIVLDHLAPTVPGRTVTARARLESVDGRALVFFVEASDDSGTIARGTHARVVVDRARFLQGAGDR